MALSEKEQKAFFDHARSKMKAPPKCPLCSSGDWSLSGPFSTPTLSGGDPLPTVALICTNCYFIFNFYWVQKG